jgi:hypothetical protein
VYVKFTEAGAVCSHEGGMEHRGKQYSVVQAIDGEWKWSIELDGHAKSGVTAGGRQAAIRMAEREIEKATAPKKRRLVPPGR